MRRMKEDDSGIAGAIGVLLILAVLVTAWANAMQTQIPLYGKEAEGDWDRDMAFALGEFTRAMGAGLTSGAPMAGILPMPPEARSLDVPLLGSASPQPPSGLIEFKPACASFTGTHVLANGTTVVDLRDGSMGCLEFQAAPIYGPAFGYRIELGALLRVQGDRAVVLAGPPIELNASVGLGGSGSNEQRISLGLPGLRGPASSASLSGASARVDLIPGPHAGEIEQAPNAMKADWRIETAYPTAWKSWFETRFAQAGFVASRPSPPVGASSFDYSLTCEPVDCSLGAGGKGVVLVNMEGPHIAGADLKLSVTYGIFDVNIR